MDGAGRRELGVMPTTEGSLALKLDLTQIIDGFAGSEHALPRPLYRDVIELVARSAHELHATLQIANGGPGARTISSRASGRSATPSSSASRRSSGRRQDAAAGTGASLGECCSRAIARGAARIQRAGGVVGIGAHGEMPGLGLHWEMEAHFREA